MKKLFEVAPLALILITSIALRTYRHQRPLADWHSWRQADTAAVTRNFVKDGINILEPRFDDLSNIPSGLENPLGYRMVEFPFINALIAFLFTSLAGFHNLPVHVFSRWISIAFSAGSTLFLYLITKTLIDKRTALISSLIFAILPFNIFFSTTTLPEVPLVFFTLVSVYFWINYSLKHSHPALIAFIPFAAAAILLKPYYVFLAPALIYFYWKHQSTKGLFHWHPYAAAIVALVPFLLWRKWILQFPEGIPNFEWLFNSTNIRFKGAFFRWLFAERIGKWILGFWGLIPFGLGIILKPGKKVGWFFHWWALGMIAYMTVFATGNVTHDYYQIILIPIISIFLGLGFNFMLAVKSDQFSQYITRSLLLIISLFTLAFSWFHIRDYFNINNPAIVEAGTVADRLLPADAKVIAPYGGDTAFLYQTNRQGWPIGGLIEQRISQGATHYVSTSLDDETRDLASRCEVITDTQNYILISLSNCSGEQTSQN